MSTDHPFSKRVSSLRKKTNAGHPGAPTHSMGRLQNNMWMHMCMQWISTGLGSVCGEGDNPQIILTKFLFEKTTKSTLSEPLGP